MCEILSFNKSRMIPKWIVLQLLEACNLRCDMCYEWGKNGAYRNKTKLNSLEFDIVKKIIEQCAIAKPYYELFGGEPLLYNRIFDVIECIKKNGSRVDIATNGTLLEKHANELLESGITRIWVSLDGDKRINDLQRGIGTYDKAISGIKRILALRENDIPKIGITTVVTPTNYFNIREFYLSFIKECRIDHVSFEFQNFATYECYSKYSKFLNENFNITETNSARGFVRDISDFDDIDCDKLACDMNDIKNFSQKSGIKFFNNPSTIDANNYRNYFKANWNDMLDKRNKCPFVYLHAEVSASGDVIMCHTLQDLNFGNVNKEDFLDIWNNKHCAKYRRLLRKEMMPMCIACSRYYTQTEGHS